MWFERIVAEGLSHTSYLVGSGGQAAAIDPRRDCDSYLDRADRHDAVITHIFETHRNEDYVSGALELAHRCSAKIYHGSRMDFAYGNAVREGDRFTLGTLELFILETPGHTEESITVVLVDAEVSREPYMVFSGDTLFAGDIARTDFFGPTKKAEMAGKIYDSISTKILPLGDGVILCPAHGAGSACGSEIADHPFSTIGYERRANPVLALKKDAFIARRTTESPYLPPYFRQMEIVNKDGPALLNTLPRPQPLPVAAVASLIISGCQIVDIRSPTSFAAGHIPGSLSLWRDGIASFAGWYLDYTRPIVFVDDFTCNPDAVIRHFVRMGYDTTAGWLAGGFPAWFRAARPVGTTGACTVQELEKRLTREKPFLLDVRDRKNRERIGFIPGSHHVYVGELPQHLREIPKGRLLVIYCDSGFKGSLAASVLAMHGFADVISVLGGMQAWIKAGYPVER
ncbi:rhodanese-like domain-containing protein [Methanoregula sp.]|jgi:hydroxyacylglutathione hydrolase|uniref:MBL fold metallo-hydrolase n=1 Tax=Methanoregula sp. TaxID=2052170 RepID=UPI0025CFAE62|nr:MBL fold metallo-hydrolase [Methanoregula sp.]